MRVGCGIEGWRIEELFTQLLTRDRPDLCVSGDRSRVLRYGFADDLATRPLIRTTGRKRMHPDRAQQVADFIQDAKGSIQENGVRPETLDRVLHALERLAGQRALWSEAEFPSPGPDEQQ